MKNRIEQFLSGEIEELTPEELEEARKELFSEEL